MVVGVSNQRVEVQTRFYAGEQFPFSKIYGFGGTDKLKDVHLTFKEYDFSFYFMYQTFLNINK